MPEKPRARLARMRKRLAIPREQYLAAVDRQEHRAWAHRTDPRWTAEMQMRFKVCRNQILASEGKDPEPLPDPEPAEEPDPAVFDTEDQIKRDDALMEAYLSDNPSENRRPNARGHTHAELLKYWRSCPEGKKYHEDFSREMMLKIVEIRDRFDGHYRNGPAGDGDRPALRIVTNEGNS